MKTWLEKRLALKPYIETLMKEASENGAPLMRTMFYEFPEDERCWNLSDQYMFGSKYLVAPILNAGQREREVYLPAGSWKDFRDGKSYEGGRVVCVQAPIDSIPVFEME